MGQRLDKIVHTTGFEAYKNYLTERGAIVVPAVAVPNGDFELLSDSVPYTRQGTRVDVYLDNGTKKVLVTGVGNRAAVADVYNFKSTELATVNVQYLPSPSNVILVTLNIENFTGSSITLNAQTLNLTVVEYDAPITPV